MSSQITNEDYEIYGISNISEDSDKNTPYQVISSSTSSFSPSLSSSIVPMVRRDWPSDYLDTDSDEDDNEPLPKFDNRDNVVEETDEARWKRLFIWQPHLDNTEMFLAKIYTYVGCHPVDTHKEYLTKILFEYYSNSVLLRFWNTDIKRMINRVWEKYEKARQCIDGFPNVYYISANNCPIRVGHIVHLKVYIPANMFIDKHFVKYFVQHYHIPCAKFFSRITPVMHVLFNCCEYFERPDDMMRILSTWTKYRLNMSEISNWPPGSTNAENDLKALYPLVPTLNWGL